MATIKKITKFIYEGYAYNLFVSEAGKKYSPERPLFDDGLVHPDFIIYNIKGYPEKISEIENGEIILFTDNKKWKVEKKYSICVKENFFEIQLSDDRILKVNIDYKIKLKSAKNLNVKELNINDEIEEPSLQLLGSHVRSTERS